MSSGLHHVTAITGRVQANVAFYASFLGLRLVKRTAGFADGEQLHPLVRRRGRLSRQHRQLPRLGGRRAGPHRAQPADRDRPFGAYGEHRHVAVAGR
jgi:catechol 2,3-dioxygenase-like lactoylglutathione lyase family enzyme